MNNLSQWIYSTPMVFYLHLYIFFRLYLSTPALASIVVSPAPIIVTLPLLSTVTTCSFLDIQVTVLLVAFDGDLTKSETSGVDSQLRGTFLGACQTGTTNHLGQKTGFDYISDLGVNVV